MNVTISQNNPNKRPLQVLAEPNYRSRTWGTSKWLVVVENPVMAWTYLKYFEIGCGCLGMLKQCLDCGCYFFLIGSLCNSFISFCSFPSFASFTHSSYLYLCAVILLLLLYRSDIMFSHPTMSSPCLCVYYLNVLKVFFLICFFFWLGITRFPWPKLNYPQILCVQKMASLMKLMLH